MFKNTSIQRKIFISYSIVFTLIIIILISILYIYIVGQLQESSINVLRQAIENISSKLDNSIIDMDTQTTRVMLSSNIQDALSASQFNQNSDNNYFDYNFDTKNRVNNVLVSILGTKNDFRRISVFNNKANFISVGQPIANDYHVIKNIQNSSWIKDTIDLNGQLVIVPPHRDNWLTAEDAPLVISASRSIFYSTNFVGIVEVQQLYEKFNKICDIDLRDVNIVVYDTRLFPIYPLDPSVINEIRFFNNNNDKLIGSHGTLLKNPISNKKELVYMKKSGTTGWTVVLSQSESAFMNPIYKIQLYIIVAGILLLALTLFVVFILTKSLTSPIRSLKESVKKITLENLTVKAHSLEGNNEILQLKEAFDDILIQLKESVSIAVKSRSSEIHAHFLAYQSQMDPHFLYNTLMAINDMVYEKKYDNITSVCIQASNMLRYIASFKNEDVTIRDEIFHTQNYLKLNKYRYEELLEYEIIFDDNVLDIRVPKLILQPLVENSINHGLSNKRPPWKISIRGFIKEGRWYITISDNGLGFNPEVIEELMQKADQYGKVIYEGNVVPNLEIGGMGIINIIIRLNIFFGENANFSIINNSAGCTVSLSGPCNEFLIKDNLHI